MSYIPPYQITDKVLALVADISEKIGKITERTNLDSKPHLRKNNKIKSIHSSLKIEANSLSLDEVRDVINGRTVMGERKEIQEVKNAYAAYEEIGKFDVYNLNDFKRLHGVMTKYIVEESGCFRKGEEGVFNGDKCIFMAPPAKFVPEQMQNLFDWMQKSRDTVHPLILAAVFHYEFVFIHPFQDGNGRIARFWQNAILSKYDKIFEVVTIENMIEKKVKIGDNMSDSLRAIAEERVERKIKFKRHLFSYVTANVILAIINLVFSPEYLWFLWVALFWGIGVVIDFLKTYVLFDRFDSEEYRERKIQEEMEKLFKCCYYDLEVDF